MAAKDLKITGKELQMAGPRVLGAEISPMSEDRSSAVNPAMFLSGVVRRRWPLLLLAAVASGCLAWSYSSHFGKEVFTAHLRLMSRPLPFAGRRDVYSVPNVNVVSQIAVSPEVLDPVVVSHRLESVAVLAGRLSTTVDDKSGIVKLALSWPDQAEVAAVLDEIGASVVQTIFENRAQTLETHVKYVTDRLFTAVQHLDEARNDLVQQQIAELVVPSDNSKLDAELQALVANKIQLQTNLEAAARKLARCDQDAQFLTDQQTQLFSLSLRQILEGRRRQVENFAQELTAKKRNLDRDTQFLSEQQSSLLSRSLGQIIEGRRRQVDDFGQGLTAATRRFFVTKSWQKELQTLEESLPVYSGQVEHGVAVEGSLDGGSEPAVATAQQSSRNAPSEVTRSEKLFSTEIADFFLDWTTRIREVGNGAVGEFDTSTLALVRDTESKFATFSTRAYELEVEQRDLDSLVADTKMVQIDVQALEESMPGNADTAAHGHSDEGSSAVAMNLFLEWTTKIRDVGHNVVGELDSSTLTQVRNTQSKLETFSNNAHKLAVDRRDLATDIAYYEGTIEETGTLISGIEPAAVEPKQPESAALLKAEALVEEKRRQQLDLTALLARINQARDCEIREYFASEPASFDPNRDMHSNRRKLMAFSFFGGMLFFLAPVAALEWLRLRPTPVNVFSKRWKLPMLGIQAVNEPARGSNNIDQIAADQLRLAALRIQQSLVHPNGRTVLFSGLDHEETPMTLIRGLARCLSEREERVLIIQSLSSRRSADNDRETARGAHQTRLGVAEYLAGKTEDATDFIIGTGIAGIDFLPGGTTLMASEAMASGRFTALINQFRDRYTMILISGPSTLHPADLQMLAARADGIVFTVSRQSLREVYGTEVIGDLIELGAPILGFAEQPSRRKRAVPGDHPLDGDFFTAPIAAT